jgi:hypothetical protein
VNELQLRIEELWDNRDSLDAGESAATNAVREAIARSRGDGDRRRHGQANQSPMTTLTQLPALLVLESWSFGPNQKPPGIDHRAVIVDLQ